MVSRTSDHSYFSDFDFDWKENKREVEEDKCSILVSLKNGPCSTKYEGFLTSSMEVRSVDENIEASA